MDHAHFYNIMNKLQYGFRAKHSCGTLFWLTSHGLAKAYDNKLQVDMIVLEFK